MNIIEKIKTAGIIGLGGAGFPTHIKLNSKPEFLIINGAECEPLLRNDRYIMEHFADKLVNAINALNEYFGGIRCVFATKVDYKQEVAALKKAIKENNSKAEICLLKSYYPAGDEQLIVYEVTGRTVPPSGIPLDVGCVVINVATLYSIDNAIGGYPLTKKFITVTGEVQNPMVMRVPVGTSFSDCIKLAGGTTVDKYIIIAGGPMMGKRLSYNEAGSMYVGKTTSGIIVLPSDSAISNLAGTNLEHIKNRARSSCIQCSYCTDMCPRHLLGHPLEPHKIMRKLAYSTDISSMLEDEKIREAALCSECGLCEMYACPMGLQPRTINSIIKKELQARGIRYEKGKNAGEVNDFRDYRLIPTKRAAARAGVSDYYDIVNTEKAVDYVADRVVLLLKQGIGMPSEAIVKTGDSVKLGQLIAKCKEGAVGSDLHATINGVVKVYDDRIVIE